MGSSASWVEVSQVGGPRGLPTPEPVLSHAKPCPTSPNRKRILKASPERPLRLPRWVSPSHSPEHKPLGWLAVTFFASCNVGLLHNLEVGRPGFTVPISKALPSTPCCSLLDSSRWRLHARWTDADLRYQWRACSASIYSRLASCRVGESQVQILVLQLGAE